MSDPYAFKTERLVAYGWHEAERNGAVEDLTAVVAVMLTEPVTRWLPSSWQGSYTRARAAEWIAGRDADGPVLLVSERQSGRPIGLVLLFEEVLDDSVDVRLGYLLAKDAWDQGFGGELLAGFVAWCRERGGVHSIIGGVARENAASIRLLERHGFVVHEESDDELMYRLDLTAP